ncbi:hypothetical protein ACEQUB_02614 [Ralstonia syzygii]
MATFPNFPRRAFLNLVSLFAGGALLPARLQAVGQGATAPTSVIIDTDPGQDDAIAILFALGARGASTCAR